MPDEPLAALHKIAGHVSRGDTEDEALASAVEFATGLLSCDECCTYVRQSDQLLPWVWKHTKNGTLERTALAIDDGFTAAAGTHRAPIAVCADSERGAAFKVFDDWSINPGETFVCVPFLLRGRLLGAMTLRHWRPRPYCRFEFTFLCSVGYVLGAELGIAQLEKENSDLMLELEVRKLGDREGILQQELQMSQREAYLRLQPQNLQKKPPLREVAQAMILSADARHKGFRADW